jgi:tRNA-dihydrouridine synthase
MIGRGALANPRLPFQIAAELGMKTNPDSVDLHWESLLRSLLDSMERFGPTRSSHGVKRLKQWLRLADHHGDFAHFDSIKRAESVEDLFCRLKQATQPLQLQVPAMACAQ